MSGDASADDMLAADGDAFGDRLIRRLYGLGVPARLLTHPIGRRPRLRLLATVENPLPGSAVAGTALRAGHFLIHGHRLACDTADYTAGATLAEPVAGALHGFAWLADLEASGSQAVVAPTGERLLRDWLAANPKPPRRPARAGAWTIGRTGDRLLGWLMHAPLLLSSGEKAARTATLSAIAAHARWLDRHARRAPDPAEAGKAWAALVAAGLLLPGGRPRELRARAALLRTLGELVGDDGGVLSRSPVAQMEAIALLVGVCACYRACRRLAPPDLTAMLALLLPPLTALVHADGGLGSWQGSWAVDRARIAQLVAASGDARGGRGRSPESRQWGYQRITARGCVLQVDAAPPPLSRAMRDTAARARSRSSCLARRASAGGELRRCGGGGRRDPAEPGAGPARDRGALDADAR